MHTKAQRQIETEYCIPVHRGIDRVKRIDRDIELIIQLIAGLMRTMPKQPQDSSPKYNFQHEVNMNAEKSDIAAWFAQVG